MRRTTAISNSISTRDVKAYPHLATFSGLGYQRHIFRRSSLASRRLIWLALWLRLFCPSMTSQESAFKGQLIMITFLLVRDLSVPLVRERRSGLQDLVYLWDDRAR